MDVDGIGIAFVDAMMKTDTVGADVKGESSSPPEDAKGAPSAAQGTFARRAIRLRRTISGLPKKLDDQIRRDPYSAIGGACAVGLGAGILLGSRIVRALVVSVASRAVIELARAYLRQEIFPKTDAKPAAS